MNTSLRDEIKKIVFFEIEWTDDTKQVYELPDEKVDQILNLLASKMPEKKAETEEFYSDNENLYFKHIGFNNAIDSVKSILKGGTE